MRPASRSTLSRDWITLAPASDSTGPTLCQVSHSYMHSGHTSALYQWVNPGLFTQNAVGTFGNAGHFSLRTPSYFDVDAAISRKFNLGEHFQTKHG